MQIHHLALRVDDCTRALGFYEGVLGLGERRRLEKDGELRAIWLDAGGAVLMPVSYTHLTLPTIYSV